jgi:hypothetical protein
VNDEQLLSLARMTHTKAKRVYREAEELRRLAAQLADELRRRSLDTSKEDTNGRREAVRI